MGIYALCFVLTEVMALVNEYAIKKKIKFLIILSACCIIMIPAIVAGIRDYSIGTDVNFYVRRSFDLAGNFSTLKDWLSFSNLPNTPVTGMEKGFLVLVFLTSRISGNAHFLLFFISLIIGFFIYLSLYKMKKSSSIFLGELVFLLTLYNASFNMVRQSIAMAISLFALSLLLTSNKNKYMKFLIWILIAISFHGIAIITLIFLVMYEVFKKAKYVEWKKQIAFIILSILILVFFGKIVEFAINNGIINSRYAGYVSGGTAQMTNIMPRLGIIIYVIGAIPIFVGVNYLGKYKNIFLTIAVLDIAMIILSISSFYLYRISSYYFMVRILSLSQKSLYEESDNKNRLINPNVLLMWTIFSSILYFVYFIVIHNWHQTVPYIFMS